MNERVLESEESVFKAIKWVKDRIDSLHTEYENEIDQYHSRGKGGQFVCKSYSAYSYIIKLQRDIDDLKERYSLSLKIRGEIDNDKSTVDRIISELPESAVIEIASLEASKYRDI
jgi:hypothetical protein